MKTAQTRSVLGGAYKGKAAKLDALLTHTVEVDESGAEVRVLCDRVRPENLADPLAGNTAAKPTCERCLSKDPRWRPHSSSAARQVQSVPETRAALTKDQKATLATITAAGSGGVQGEAGWTSARSLARKGLVRAEVIAENVPATKLYPQGPRYATHTLRGRLRMVTLVRWTTLSPAR